MGWRLGLKLGALLLGALLIGSCVPKWLFGPKFSAIKVERRNITQTLVVNGRVLAPRRVSLGTQAPGIVSRRLVEEGDRVKEGQLLLQLDDAEGRANLAQAQAKLAQVLEVSGPATVAQREQAEASLLQAELAHGRSLKLYQDGILTESQMDESKKTLDLARSALDSAKAQSRSASVGAEVALARAAVLLARLRVEQMSLRAPASGVILTRHTEVGDIVQAGKALFTFMHDEPMQLLVQADERSLARLSVGQKALASADAFPQDRIPVQICYIAPSIDAQRGTVDIKFCVSESPAYLRADMTVSVEIDQGRSANAVVVPVEAVRGLPGSSYVLVNEGQRAVRRKVRTGLRGETEFEILEGLQGGEILFTSSAVKPGQRARSEMNGL